MRGGRGCRFPESPGWEMRLEILFASFLKTILKKTLKCPYQYDFTTKHFRK